MSSAISFLFATCIVFLLVLVYLLKEVSRLSGQNKVLRHDLTYFERHVVDLGDRLNETRRHLADMADEKGLERYERPAMSGYRKKQGV